jgi:hypothetical protein
MHLMLSIPTCCAHFSLAAELLTEGALALLELAKKSNATSPVEAQPQQPQKSVYLVRIHSICSHVSSDGRRSGAHSTQLYACCAAAVLT